MQPEIEKMLRSSMRAADANFEMFDLVLDTTGEADLKGAPPCARARFDPSTNPASFGAYIIRGLCVRPYGNNGVDLTQYPTTIRRERVQLLIGHQANGGLGGKIYADVPAALTTQPYFLNDILVVSRDRQVEITLYNTQAIGAGFYLIGAGTRPAQ